MKAFDERGRDESWPPHIQASTKHLDHDSYIPSVDEVLGLFESFCSDQPEVAVILRNSYNANNGTLPN